MPILCQFYVKMPLRNLYFFNMDLTTPPFSPPAPPTFEKILKKTAELVERDIPNSSIQNSYSMQSNYLSFIYSLPPPGTPARATPISRAAHAGLEIELCLIMFGIQIYLLTISEQPLKFYFFFFSIYIYGVKIFIVQWASGRWYD